MAENDFSNISLHDLLMRLDAAGMNLTEFSTEAEKARFEELWAEIARRFAPDMTSEPALAQSAERKWVSYEAGDGFFSVPRTEAELRVYFEIEPGLADQREAGTEFEDWLEENERYGLLVPQPERDAPTPSDAVFTVQWTRDDVENSLYAYGLPTTPENVDLVVKTARHDLRSFEHDASNSVADILDGKISELDEAGAFSAPAHRTLEEALARHPDVQIVSLPTLHHSIETGGEIDGALGYGVYAAEEPNGFYSVCDNTSGECFTETFRTLEAAVAYAGGTSPEDAYALDSRVKGHEGQWDFAQDDARFLDGGSVRYGHDVFKPFLETEQAAFYCTEDPDVTGGTLMLRKGRDGTLEVASDNFFATDELDSAMEEIAAGECKAVYLSSDAAATLAYRAEEDGYFAHIDRATVQKVADAYGAKLCEPSDGIDLDTEMGDMRDASGGLDADRVERGHDGLDR